MAFDWKKVAESSGGDPIPDGIHLARITKIKGSKKRDDQIIVTFGNEAGSIDSFYTLTDDAIWTLARLLSRCGVDLEKMGADGIEPRHFAKMEVAEQYLLNTELWIKVYTLDKSNPKNCDANGNPYRRADPMHEVDAEKADPTAYAKAKAAATFDSNIPF